MGLDRVFITGVSPIVMSDVTSGFNIAKNIYLNPKFDFLCGFSEEDIKNALVQVYNECGLDTDVDETLSLMRTYYDGYTFNPRTSAKVYNTTSALYFLDYFQEWCEVPEKMLDDNLAMDQDKISYIASLSGGGELILNALKEAPPVSIEQLETRFGLKEMLSPKKSNQFLASLLYYFGVLTLAGRDDRGKLLLQIPNVVVRRLYVKQIQDMLLPDSDDREKGKQVAELLYTKGQMAPLRDFILEHYFKVFPAELDASSDNRDSRHLNELTVKTAFLLLLFNDHLYLMGSETEVDRGYADLTMIVRPQMRQYPSLLDILIEFKSVKLGEIKLSGQEVRKLSQDKIKALDEVKEKLKEAKEQAQRYGKVLEKKYGSAFAALAAFYACANMWW